MKDISQHILKICLDISQGEDPKKEIKKIKLVRNQRYILSSDALEALLFVLLQFYNILVLTDTVESDKHGEE